MSDEIKKLDKSKADTLISNLNLGNTELYGDKNQKT
jgi:hypothetical protein